MVLSAELEMALQRGSDAHFAQITDYLNAGGDVNDVDEHGTSMLTLNLIYEGGDHLDVDMLDEDDRLRIVRLLLARGADVNKSVRGGATPLFQACNCEDRAFGLGAIRCLLEAGANIDQKGLHGQLVETPLSTSLDWLRSMMLIGMKLASRMCLCCCDMGRIWTTAGTKANRPRTAYGTSRIQTRSQS